MKTLINCLVLILVIFLIGFTACDKTEHHPGDLPISSDPTPSTIEVTAVYTNNGPVTAVTPIWQITLISTDVQEELRDRIYTNYFYKAKGKFLIIEFTAKNLSSLPHSINTQMFSMLDKNNNVYLPDAVADHCFDNSFMFIGLLSNQEFLEPQILVFDVFDLNDLTLVFNDAGTPSIKIFFKLFNLNQSQNSN